MIFQWAVIGAGPAGIAAVGKLLDHGIEPANIAWIDPTFTVGDFGVLWRHVPSNTKVDLFLKFLRACPSFEFDHCPDTFMLQKAVPHKTCELGLMAEPLQWVTDQLKNKVKHFSDYAEKLTLNNRHWQIKLKQSDVLAKHVILATGAEPKALPFSSPVMIPLQDAMDGQRIQNHCQSEDTIGVFGSSHSAILVLRNLIENTQVKQVINFYKSPLRYAVYFDDWILFDDTGLKGPTAEWSREHLHGNLPANLQRIFSNNENIEHYLPQCNKVIYAIGFKRRTLPIIEGLGHLTYIEQTGIIAPGLFGLGIAFPEA
ncbi:MAG TPA: FAD-dependent oxidoreductase, partial [Candidatus Babeliaceae bacterium]|nr:FAD-dependent oxidoreductase [Candidatus Babeliaceae bacterium]